MEKVVIDMDAVTSRRRTEHNGTSATPTTYRHLDSYYAGPFCSCGDYSCPRSEDPANRCHLADGI